jgi:HEAT repeat protein
MALITSGVTIRTVMWPFFSNSWLGRFGRRGSSVAAAARSQSSEWRFWLASAISRINRGEPCRPEDAVRQVELLPIAQLLQLDEELRKAARYLDVTTRRQNFALSRSAAEAAETTAYLFTACGNCNGYVREAALTAFGNHPSRLAFAAALIRCDDWVPQVQRAASMLLGRLLESDSAPMIFEALPLLLRLRQRRRISEEIWPQQVEPLLRSPHLRQCRWSSTKSLDTESRAYAYRLVFETDSDRALEVLFEASADRHPKISVWALGLANTFGSSEAQLLLKSSLRHPNSEVRAQALRLFAQLEPADLREQLGKLLFDASRGPRDVAVYLLDQHFKESGLKHWRDAIDSGTPYKRHIALAALSYAAAPEDVSRLQSFIREPSARVRACALRGLVRADAPHADQYLVAALKDSSAFVIRYALNLTSKQNQLFALKDLKGAFETAPSEATRRQLSFAARLLGKWESLEFLFWLTMTRGLAISGVGFDRWLVAANRRFTSLDENTRSRLLGLLQDVAARVPDARWSRIEMVLRRS